MYWLPIHTTNFEAIKSLIVQAPVLHLPACTQCFYLECDSSTKHVGSVLYQIQNGTNMLLPFTVQQCQMQLAGINHSCIFNICWNTQLSLSSWTIVPLNRFTVLANLRKRSVYRNFWKKSQIFLSIFNIYLANTCSCVTFFHTFLQTTMMKSQYLISRILHYSIMLHTWHSWTLSANLTITWVRAYVHLIHFQLQGHRRNCRKSVVYLNQA